MTTNKNGKRTITRYIVISTEHAEFIETPNVLGVFTSKREAEKFRAAKIRESMKEFPGEKRYGSDVLVSYGRNLRDGETDIIYGYAVVVRKVEIELKKGE